MALPYHHHFHLNWWAFSIRAFKSYLIWCNLPSSLLIFSGHLAVSQSVLKEAAKNMSSGRENVNSDENFPGVPRLDDGHASWSVSK